MIALIPKTLIRMIRALMVIAITALFKVIWAEFQPPELLVSPNSHQCLTSDPDAQ